MNACLSLHRLAAVTESIIAHIDGMQRMKAACAHSQLSSVSPLPLRLRELNETGGERKSAALRCKVILKR